MFFRSSLYEISFLALLVGAGASPVQKRQTHYPAIQKDFPDPSVMQAPDGYHYAYGTAGNGVQIQVAKSGDGFSWEYQDGVDALSPGSIAWAPEDPSVWAPDVTPGANGYVMYFSAVATNSADGSKHCIGVATSDDPMGPFVPVSDEPWVCDYDTGDIDPDQFYDDADGSRWVTWKVDGNSAGSDSTPIMLQQVEDDGYTKIGDPIQILDRDDNDGPLIEAPSIWKWEDIYYLTFSSNMYNTDKYDVSFATASSITGPWTKAHDPDAPIITTGNHDTYGPGGADFFKAGDVGNAMLFHSWDSPDMNERWVYMVGVGLYDNKIEVYWGDI